MIIRLFIYSLLMLVLSSCALNNNLEDGYQFGDLARSAIEDLAQYCDTSNEVGRMAARTAFALSAGYPFPVNACVAWEQSGEGVQ